MDKGNFRLSRILRQCKMRLFPIYKNFSGSEEAQPETAAIALIETAETELLSD